jgi:hypothetical protein
MVLLPLSRSCRFDLSVKFGENVTREGVRVFLEQLQGSNIKLKRFQVGLGVKQIGFMAFSGYNVPNVLFPPNGCLSEISPLAFAICSLREAILPPTLCRLGESVFEECHYLRRVVFAENGLLTEIPKNFCKNCPALRQVKVGLSDVNCPLNVTYIGDEAFFGCQLLENDFWCPVDGMLKRIEPTAFLNSGVTTLFMSTQFQWESDIFPGGIDVFIQRESDGKPMPLSTFSESELAAKAKMYDDDSDSLESL